MSEREEEGEEGGDARGGGKERHDWGGKALSLYVRGRKTTYICRKNDGTRTFHRVVSAPAIADFKLPANVTQVSCFI